MTQASPQTPVRDDASNQGDDDGDEGILDANLHDYMEAEEAYEETAFRNLEWWDTIEWDRLLLVSAPTTAMIPDSMTSAIGRTKVRVCLALEQAHSGWEGMHPSTPERLWKVFLALDGLLFAEGATPTADTRRERLTERLKWIQDGQWDVAWNTMEAQCRTSPTVRAREDKIGDRVRRVTELVQAGELSRAAAAVWPQGDMADAQAVVTKFTRTQTPDPPVAGQADATMAGQDEGARGTGDAPGALAPPGAGSAELRCRVATHLKTQFGRFPRRGAQGQEEDATNTGPRSSTTKREQQRWPPR